jgi:Putative metallopeptidase
MSTNCRFVQPLVLAIALLASLPALAQSVPILRGLSGIQIDYAEPANPAHKRIYERLKKRQVLEQFKEFMSPLKLKRPLFVSLQECGVPNAFHRDSRIVYCYELVAQMETDIASTNVLPGFRREDALVGGFVSTMLHEAGHAIFYLLEIPIFGREEDAADAIASYVALQFGDATARRIMTGTAFVWRAQELARQRGRPTRPFEDYADEHGTHAQRFYNTLCIALGRDMVEKTTVFSDFASLLPNNRRGHCPREYLHVKNSFQRFVLPHVDADLMKKVRATEWVRTEDGTEILPPQLGGPRSIPGPGGPGPLGPAGPTAPGSPR